MTKWTPGEVKVLKRARAAGQRQVALADRSQPFFSAQEIKEAQAALKRRRARTAAARARRKPRPKAR